MDIASPEFWVAVGQIILIDILLGGDNAVVIALASRRLPEEQRRRAVFWGVVGAVLLRVVLIFFAVQLLQVPFLKLTAGLLLVWIGVKLLLPQPDEGGHHINPASHLLGAIRTIIVADAVMSLDNVIAIAAAAREHMGLVVFGLVFSVPIVVWGSRFVLHLMDRFPAVILGGAALLGWIAGSMIVNDQALHASMAAWLPGWWIHLPAVAGALLVVAVGELLARRRPAATGLTDLASRQHDQEE